MRRFPMIDGLRLLAAGLVLLSHVAFWTGAGDIDVRGPLLARGDSGVAVFFAISAFLLLRPWLRAEGDGVDLRRYAVHRAVRILPAYWVALLAVILVLVLRTGSVGSPATLVWHVFLLQGYTGTDYQAFTQTWSLTTEVTFYALVPLIGPALRKLLQAGVVRCLGALSIAGLVGVLAQIAATAGSRAGEHTWPRVLATCVIGHSLWFAVGATIAVLRTPQGRAWCSAQPWSRHLASLSTAGLLGLAGITYLLLSLPWAGPVGLQVPTVAAAVVKECGYALLAGLLLLAAVRPAGDQAAATVASSSALRTAGGISYAVFLWHVLVLQVMYLIAGWPLFSGGFGWMLFAVVVFTAIVSYASFVLIERPALTRWASSPVREQPAPGARV